jgi:hypothetical protein
MKHNKTSTHSQSSSFYFSLTLIDAVDQWRETALKQIASFKKKRKENHVHGMP